MPLQYRARPLRQNNIAPEDMEPGAGAPSGGNSGMFTPPSTGQGPDASYIGGQHGYGGAFGGARRGGRGGFAGPLKRLRNTEVLAQIQDIIGRRGATDPGRLNLELAGIDRGVAGERATLAGQASGVGDSGYLSALDQAIAASGREEKAGSIARENALAEQRQRDDILNLVLGPLERRAGRKAQLRAAMLAARQRGSGFDIGGALGTLAQLFNNIDFGKGNGNGGGFGDGGVDTGGDTALGNGSDPFNYGTGIY